MQIVLPLLSGKCANSLKCNKTRNEMPQPHNESPRTNFRIHNRIKMFDILIVFILRRIKLRILIDLDESKYQIILMSNYYVAIYNNCTSHYVLATARNK